ncbi:hypothetical protein DFJ73DRAFT_666682 [Zopfochytrium polystomum]|nr:hypothetical protein DFJ73DRAFT_666682 [Zopfochytrium polystomum]
MAAAAPLDIHAVAKQFTEYYYGVFDSNRAGLLPLYRDYSMMTYESKQVSGAQQIVQYLVERPFQAIQHVITTVDVQPSHPSQGSILITVMGQLKVRRGEAAASTTTPHGFMQVFNLYPEGPGQYFVYNGQFVDLFFLCLEDAMVCLHCSSCHGFTMKTLRTLQTFSG